MNPNTTRGCKACGDKAKDDRYVQCDECDDWWHFSCAGVTSSIESMQACAWLCEKCIAETLKEQPSPEANEQPQATTSKLSQPNRKLGAAAEGVACEDKATKSLRSVAEVSGGTPLAVREHVAGPNLNKDAASGDVARQLEVLKRRQEVERRRLDLELQLKFVKEEEALLGLGRDNLSTISPQVDSFQPGKRAVKYGEEEDPDITPRQVAARQTVSKELPTFSGDPAEWPIFISHYENSTRRCGYSNWENMLRLQKCLKGPALEAVRSRLVLPETVPLVIDKLRKRYGQPVHLLNTLIEKVRRIPAPRMDKLDSIIEYGEAVQCMVDHMVAAGERAHITNPLLLAELVNKLPRDQQMLWSRNIREMTSVDLSTFGEYMEGLAEDASLRQLRLWRRPAVDACCAMVGTM
uniref:PHD-type domain-containing protein n=1 Tax=Anopheles epiroticus TaxID=199890 RepID=A0A182NZC7_9DIPT